MKKFKYFPLVKTRDAELRCMMNLNLEVIDNILPIYELTKSRISKKSPDGDIHKRMQKLMEIQGGRPFILDLNTSEKYMNAQIENLISNDFGFYEWRFFIDSYDKDNNIIPMIHLYEDEDMVFEDVKKFVSLMSLSKKFLAVRIPSNLSAYDLDCYFEPIASAIGNGCKIFIIVDGEYLDRKNPNSFNALLSGFVTTISHIKKFSDIIEDIVMTTTSFPSSPAEAGRGDDAGEFEILEERLYRDVNNLMGGDVRYGDYSSINIEQLEIKGGTFVPRIDVAVADKFIYKRYRRDDGSYTLCAKNILADYRYKNLATWADKEINLAANGNPTGISPAYWISVRMCYYITSRLILRNQV